MWKINGYSFFQRNADGSILKLFDILKLKYYNIKILIRTGMEL